MAQNHSPTTAVVDSRRSSSSPSWSTSPSASGPTRPRRTNVRTRVPTQPRSRNTRSSTTSTPASAATSGATSVARGFVRPGDWPRSIVGQPRSVARTERRDGEHPSPRHRRHRDRHRRSVCCFGIVAALQPGSLRDSTGQQRRPSSRFSIPPFVSAVIFQLVFAVLWVQCSACAAPARPASTHPATRVSTRC